MYWSVSCSVCQSVGQPISHSITQPINQSTNQSITQPNNQPNNSINQTMYGVFIRLMIYCIRDQTTMNIYLRTCTYISTISITYPPHTNGFVCLFTCSHLVRRTSFVRCARCAMMMPITHTYTLKSNLSLLLIML